MARILPAIRGQIGSNEYYSAKVSAQDLIASARPASDQDAWADMAIEERIQREINLNRVRSEILPYLVASEDRFFASFVIVLFTEPEFESVEKFAKGIPAAYAEATKDMGYLILNRGDAVILDGQHRYKAIEFALRRKDDKGQEVAGEYLADIVNDEFAVLLLTFDDTDPEGSLQRIRRIFNKLNRYARQTSRADNIITSEDDGNAILTRRLMNTGEPFGLFVEVKKGATVRRESIVNYKSSTIAKRSVQFTSISALHATVQSICRFYGFYFDEKSTGGVRPSDEDLDEAYEHVMNWWEAVIANIPVLTKAFEDPTTIRELRQQPEGSECLLFKPAGQIVLFKALELAANAGEKDGGNFDIETTTKRLAKVDWDVMHDLWRGVLVLSNGRIVARAENYSVTAEMLHYMVNADSMDEEEKEAVRKAVGKAKGHMKSVTEEDADGKERTRLEDKDPKKPYQLPATVEG